MRPTADCSVRGVQSSRTGIGPPLPKVIQVHQGDRIGLLTPTEIGGRLAAFIGIVGTQEQVNSAL
jgi:hypothetical protein